MPDTACCSLLISARITPRRMRHAHAVCVTPTPCAPRRMRLRSMHTSTMRSRGGRDHAVAVRTCRGTLQGALVVIANESGLPSIRLKLLRHVASPC